ncbi:MAG: outer membrane beta-barrel protein [Marinifilum sp.]|jgi:hypothetical protein|nr:outer membrane beta-barrel protein [Marinifilum sp.]
MKYFLVIILTIISAKTYSATHQVHGKLKDASTKQAIEFATIAVMHYEKDIIINSMITDSKGEFSFASKPGDYKLKIRCMGYKPIFQTIKVTNKDLFLKPLEMSVELNEISEVNVVASNYSEKYDRSIQTVTRQFKEGTNKVTDLLTKIRGIYVDPLDNSITVDNEKSVLLLVDGMRKDQAYVKSLPPDRVSRIEITRNPTGRYISQGYTSVVNIILKKNYTGYDLFLEEQAFFSLDKSNGDDFLFKNKATANLTYTIKKFNLYGSYSNTKSNTNLLVENQKSLKNQRLDKTAISNDPNVERDGLSHNYLVGADVFINQNQTLSLETNFIRSPFSKNSSTQVYTNEVDYINLDNIADFNSQLNHSQSEDAQNSLLSYRNKLSDKNMLELDYAYNQVKSRILNNYFEDNQELNNQEIKSKSNISILDLNFKHTFNSKYALEIGYRNTYRTYRYTYLSPTTGRDKNKDIRNIGYGYLSIAPKGKIKSKIGIAFEQNTLKINNQSKDYYSVQPFLNIFYRHSKNLNITLKLNTDSDYPYANQVSPFETTTDRLTTETGNPNLEFSTNYTSSIDFKLFKNRLSIEPYYSKTEDFISQTGNIIDGHYQYTYSNLDKYESVGVKLGTRLPIIPKKMFFNFTGSLYFDKTEFNGYTNKIDDISINSNLMYMHGKRKTLYALMLKRMNSKQIQTYGYYSNDNDYLGFFIKQPFFRKRLNVSVLYILPIETGFKYSMKDHYMHGQFSEDNQTDVGVLTNLFMLKLSFNLSKGNKVQSIKKKDYKDKKESKGLF